jgi:hypothetical protein
LCDKYSDKEREREKVIVELHHNTRFIFYYHTTISAHALTCTLTTICCITLSLSLQPTPEVGPESVAGMEVGMRCEVTLGGRRGEVCYVGEVPELSGGGHWVGVRFDEPVGKSNGSAKGKQYFECNDHHGGWVRGYKLKVGDYPEKEFNFDEDSDEDEI